MWPRDTFKPVQAGGMLAAYAVTAEVVHLQLHFRLAL